MTYMVGFETLKDELRHKNGKYYIVMSCYSTVKEQFVTVIIDKAHTDTCIKHFKADSRQDMIVNHNFIINHFDLFVEANNSVK